jgi:hypothetical protein
LQVKDHDLRQLDAERLRQLGQRQPEALVELSVRLLEDLKEARERLNQNPDNSSHPPSTRDPWSRDKASSDTATTVPATDSADQDPSPEGNPAQRKSSQKPSPPSRRPGKQPGAPGQARTQVLALTRTLDHAPEHCALCTAALPPERSRCYTGFTEEDVEFGDASQPGLRVVTTQHRYFQSACACGHLTRCEPYRAPPTGGDWAGVALTEWRLIGPGLAALLVWLHFRLHLPVRRCREFSLELFGLSLSVGAIQQAIHEAARACEPIPQQIQEQILHSELLHADETPHYQSGQFLWLWVVASTTAVLFFIGRRYPKSCCAGASRRSSPAG